MTVLREAGILDRIPQAQGLYQFYAQQIGNTSRNPLGLMFQWEVSAHRTLYYLPADLAISAGMTFDGVVMAIAPEEMAAQAIAIRQKFLNGKPNNYSRFPDPPKEVLEKILRPYA